MRADSASTSHCFEYVNELTVVDEAARDRRSWLEGDDSSDAGASVPLALRLLAGWRRRVIDVVD